MWSQESSGDGEEVESSVLALALSLALHLITSPTYLILPTSYLNLHCRYEMLEVWKRPILARTPESMQINTSISSTNPPLSFIHQAHPDTPMRGIERYFAATVPCV